VHVRDNRSAARATRRKCKVERPADAYTKEPSDHLLLVA